MQKIKQRLWKTTKFDQKIETFVRNHIGPLALTRHKFLDACQETNQIFES